MPALSRAGPGTAGSDPREAGTGPLGQDRGVLNQPVPAPPDPPDLPDVPDHLGPSDAGTDRHPLVERVTALARDLLEPNAATVDAGQVPRSHLDALAAAGVFGMSGPQPDGAGPVPAPVFRRVQEVLAGADASTWFVQVQHHSVVRALAGRVEDGQDRWREPLAGLTSGRLVGGIAYSHLRRWPDRPVAAVRVPGGWRLDGTAPWYSGWELNDLALLAGASQDGEVVLGLLPARPAPGLRVTELRLAALQATRTVALHLEGMLLPDRDVVEVLPVDAWAAADARPTVNANPAWFGIALRALDLLAEHGRRPGEVAAGQAAERLRALLLDVRARAYRLIDQVPPDDETGLRLELRARTQQVMVDITSALVLAGAGRAMAAGAPAQRLAREAMFMLIQAQTAPARAAALSRWGTR
jgi:alkylation response protein AidB-like acyl-CoA dehydrogenase